MKSKRLGKETHENLKEKVGRKSQVAKMAQADVSRRRASAATGRTNVASSIPSQFIPSIKSVRSRPVRLINWFNSTQLLVWLEFQLLAAQLNAIGCKCVASERWKVKMQPARVCVFLLSLSSALPPSLSLYVCLSVYACVCVCMCVCVCVCVCVCPSVSFLPAIFRYFRMCFNSD